jgi:DNA polymerase III subunit gamma/tau
VDCSLSAEVPAESERPVKAAPQPQKSPAPAPAAYRPQPTKETAPPAAVPPRATPAAVQESKAAPPPAHSTPPKAAPGSVPVSQPQPVAAATTPLEAGSELERLRQNWNMIVREAPQDIRKSAALAFLRSAPVRLLSFENDVVVLAFRYPVHKEQIEKPDNQKIVDKLVSSYLGRSCRVSCVLQEENHLLKAALNMGAQIIDTEER